MNEMHVGPLQYAAQFTLRFLTEVMPDRPCSILDVGCGQGHLANALTEIGHSVLAIDPDPDAVAIARANGIDTHCVGIEAYDAGPFDVMFFGRSLHHMNHLHDALDRSGQLLARSGLLVLEEFGVERPDERTAAWFYDHVDEFVQEGLISSDEDDPGPSHAPLDRWMLEHRHDPPLHSSLNMREAVLDRFVLQDERDGAAFFRTLCHRLPATPAGTDLAWNLHEEECRAIESESIRAVGWRLVASTR